MKAEILDNRHVFLQKKKQKDAAEAHIRPSDWHLTNQKHKTTNVY
jgi:hypothetical protein